MCADQSSETIRVLYIVGAGRSGSTALDMLLGSHPEVEGVGELAKLTRSFGQREYCACGLRAAACDFWADVWHRWSVTAGGDPATIYPPLQARYERLRQAPWLSFAAHRGKGRFAAYERLTLSLFQAVAAAGGLRVVVDSSKSPGRALALSRVGGLDLRLIHLIRDCRGVVYSYHKRFHRDLRRGLEREMLPTPPRRVALAWMISNLAAAWVARTVPSERRTVVRYEELVSHPDRALAEIGKVAGLDTVPLAAALKRREELPVGHVVSGNRVRMSGRLRLIADLEWRDRMSERDKTKVWRLCGGLLRHYGYQR